LPVLIWVYVTPSDIPTTIYGVNQPIVRPTDKFRVVFGILFWIQVTSDFDVTFDFEGILLIIVIGYNFHFVGVVK
jgi:hypothetical protein